MDFCYNPRVGDPRDLRINWQSWKIRKKKIWIKLEEPYDNTAESRQVDLADNKVL